MLAQLRGCSPRPAASPPPWTVIEHAWSFWVQDASGQFSANEETARQAEVLTRDTRMPNLIFRIRQMDACRPQRAKFHFCQLH